MKNVVSVVVLAFSLGCTTAVVRPYVGEQPAWPTAGGSVINTRYNLPIFTTLPSAPYTVIAELRIESPFYATPEPGQLPVLVKKAKQLGADALVLVEPRSFFNASTVVAKTPGAKPTGPATVSNFFNPEAFKGSVSVVAIRWTGAPPQGLPSRYVRQDAPVVVKAEVEEKEIVESTKVETKTNFGPLRPAKEQRRDVTGETIATNPVENDPRKVPVQ